MEKFSFNEKTFALGLYWSHLSGEKVAAEVAAISEEMSMSLGVLRKINIDGVKQHQVGLCSEKTHKGLVSAAAILAELEESLFLIEKLNDDKYWICAIDGHQVIGGGDVITSLEKITEVAQDIFNTIGENLQSVRICISEEIKRETSIEGDEQIGFFDILKEHEVKNIQKSFKHCVVKNIKGIPRAAVLFAVFTILCGGTGYMLFGSNDESEAITEEQISSHANEVDQADLVLVKKEPTRAELLAKAYEEEKNWLSDMMDNKNASSTITQIHSFINKLSINNGGWTITEANYDESSPDVITLRWLKTGPGTSLILKKSIGSYDSISFGLDGKTAVSSHKVININKNNHGDIVSFISNAKYNFNEMMHDLESLNYIWKITPVAMTERPEPIDGITDPSLAKTRQLTLKIKAFNISGSGTIRLLDTVRIMNKATTSVIKNIQVNVDKDFEWSINGEIYEK
jgi:Pilin accessory protein (PilO).